VTLELFDRAEWIGS